MTTAVTDTDNFRRGLSAFQAGQFKDAERLFKAVLRIDRKHVAALNLLGTVLTQLGGFSEAETYFRRALEQQPQSEVTLYNYGLVLKALVRPAEALECFTRALAVDSAVAETWNNRGAVFNDLKRYKEAIEDFDRAIKINPQYAEAFCNKGKSLTMLERYEEASSAFAAALALKPDLAEAWLGRSNIHLELKQYDDALAAYDRTLALKPELAEAWHGRGKVFGALRRYEDAGAAFERALALNPDFAEAWLGRGNIFFERRQYDQAMAGYDRTLALQPDLPDAWLGRGNVFSECKQYDQAMAGYDRALALKPDLADAWLGRGNVFLRLGRRDEALAAYDRALAIEPGLAQAWLGRGGVFFELGQYDDAVIAYDRALSFDPDLCKAWLGRGSVFFVLRRYQDALAAYDRALSLDPGLAETWHSRGNLLAELKQFDDAFAAYDRALALNPTLDYAASLRLYAKLQLCDWTNLEADIARVLSMTRARETLSVPFTFFAIPSSPADQLQCTKEFVRSKPAFPPIWRSNIYSHDRIRVAYLSADFREHAVAHLTAGLFEHHDKSRFEITALSFASEEDSATRDRIKRAFEHFIDVDEHSDQDVATLIRRNEIDIVVDLMGYTAQSRAGVLARRAAPIQVNYIGYSGTTGADYMDYILADSTIIPADHREYYTEKVVWLPDSYLVNDSRRAIADRTPTRRECGLPEDGFVYCCFNNSYKIAPEIFQLWMRLLTARDDSVLWLSEANPTAQANLRREAERCGVPAQRLIFASRTADVADHLARHRHADLFLDTLPYDAHTTTCDALWAGVPVLTCLGATFVGRVAASLLKAVGLDELITHSLHDYEALARKLAADETYLRAVKDALSRNRTVYPLFNTARSARHIEAAYVTMWHRYQRAEEPQAFAVDPIK